MAFLVLLGVLAMFLGLVWLVVSFIKKSGKMKPVLTIVIGFIVMIVGAINMPSSNNEEKSANESKKTETTKETKNNEKAKDEEKTKADDRSEFYIIDKLVEENEVGNEIMTKADYDGFAVNGFLLEGAINKFGLPSHVTGAMKGDETMEVTYPSNEAGYSIGLVFKYEPGGFGDWKLQDKYVVETDGIGFSEYTQP